MWEHGKQSKLQAQSKLRLKQQKNGVRGSCRRVQPLGYDNYEMQRDELPVLSNRNAAYSSSRATRQRTRHYGVSSTVKTKSSRLSRGCCKMRGKSESTAIPVGGKIEVAEASKDAPEGTTVLQREPRVPGWVPAVLGQHPRG